MDIVNKLFKNKTKEITFIELKKGTSLDINGYILKGGLTLPVITDTLLHDLQYGDMQDEINLENVINGIEFLLGTDPDFTHMDKYKEIIYAYDKNINKHAFFNGMKALEKGETENAGIFFRSCIELDEFNLDAKLNYALVLETMAMKLIEDDKVDEGEQYLRKSTNILEEIVELDEKYSLAYYKLGYHYRYHSQFLKTKITWNKFITLDNNEERLQEIREQLDFIDDDVKMETGLSYYSYNDFGKALEAFLRLMPKHEKNWNINYMIGLCYKGLEDFESAIDYLSFAISLNKEEGDIYNDLGIVYFLQGKILEAIKIFTDGIEETEADYKLYFNRGLGYIQLGEFSLALRDINIANELNPDDENIIIQKREVEGYLNTL